jgi:hypothetical protein
LHPHRHTGSRRTDETVSYINIEPNPRFFTPPQCRTKSYKDSFFPTVLDLWNKLYNDTRNIQSLSSFKIKLNEDVDKSPSFYSIGSRSLNIWHCQLRNEASPVMKWWTASNISVFSSTVRIGEPFNNISKFKTSWNFLRELKSHLSDSSQFACGDAIENNFHYFYVCPLFIRNRIQLFNFEGFTAIN